MGPPSCTKPWGNRKPSMIYHEMGLPQNCGLLSYFHLFSIYFPSLWWVSLHLFYQIWPLFHGADLDISACSSTTSGGMGLMGPQILDLICSNPLETAGHSMAPNRLSMFFNESIIFSSLLRYHGQKTAPKTLSESVYRATKSNMHGSANLIVHLFRYV